MKGWVGCKTCCLSLNWLIKAARQLTRKQGLKQTNDRKPSFPRKSKIVSNSGLMFSCCQERGPVTNFSCLAPSSTDKSLSSNWNKSPFCPQTNHPLWVFMLAASWPQQTFGERVLWILSSLLHSVSLWYLGDETECRVGTPYIDRNYINSLPEAKVDQSESVFLQKTHLGYVPGPQKFFWDHSIIF